MKKNLLVFVKFFVLSVLTNSAVAQVIPNAGFENWTIGSSGYLDPDGWLTSNFSPDPSIVQAAGHSGTYSVRLKTIPDGGGGVFGGDLTLIYNGSIKPIAISGFWKFNNAGGLDGIFMNLNVFSSTTLVGSITDHTPGNAPNWISFNDSISYGSGLFPDHFNLVFNFFPSSSSLNGYGDLDDLAFTYLTGMNDTVVAHFPAANLLPGATGNSYNLFIDILSHEKIITQVFDLQGRMLMNNSEMMDAGHHEVPLDLNQFGSGMYIYVVTLGNKTHCFKINKM